MNKLYKFLTVLIALTFATSCELDEDLNDPNNVTPQAADPTLLMNAIQTDFASFFARASGSNSVLTNGVDQLMRMRAMTGGGNYQTAFQAQNLDEIWEDAYQNVLVNIETMIPLAEASTLTTHVAVGKILKAYVYITLVDLFGNVPRSEASLGAANLNPVPESGAEIYTYAISLLNEARTELAKTGAAAGLALSRDIFYGGNRTRWTAMANTLELKAWLNVSALPSRRDEARTRITALLAADIIDTDAEEFTYKYGTADNPTTSRHPIYQDYYRPALGAAGGYIGTYFLRQAYNGTGVQDPRWRYYFYRQVGSIRQALAVDPESCPCVDAQGRPLLSQIPAKYTEIGADYCVFDPGFFGRDHGDNSGGPPDSNVITTAGVYPAGGRVDTNNGVTTFWQPTQQGQGANGRGIEPIFMASFTSFMKAEIALTLGIGDATTARADLIAGVDNSINRVRSFATTLGQTLPSGVEPSQITYRTQVGNLYDNAASNADRLDIVIKELYKASWGNAIEPYNAYRRTGFPRNITPVLAPTEGNFLRTLIYPAVHVNLNSSASQKLPTDKVFWDGTAGPLK